MPARARQEAVAAELQQLGADTYIEIGPRRALTGLVKKILPGAVVHNIEDVPSMTAYLKTAHAG